MSTYSKDVMAPDLPECGHSEHAAPLSTLPPDRELERAAGMFRAAGDPGRLRLLAQLLAGEQCVTELVQSVGAGFSTVSQQLRTLRSEGLVSTRREGKHVFYSLADGHVVELIRSVLQHAAEV